MIMSGKKIFFTIWGILFAAIFFAIVYVSAQVTGLEKQISSIDTQIIDIKDDIRTSKTEWAFLTNPARIAEISKKVLPDLQKITAKDIMSLESIPASTQYIDVSAYETEGDMDSYSVIKVAD